MRAQEKKNKWKKQREKKSERESGNLLAGDIVLKRKIKKHQFTPFFLHCLLDANFLIQNFFYTDKTVAKAANFIISFCCFFYILDNLKEPPSCIYTNGSDIGKGFHNFF